MLAAVTTTLSVSGQTEAELVGSLGPAATYEHIRTLEGTTAGYIASDSAGTITLYDLQVEPTGTAQLSGVSGEQFAIARVLPDAFSGAGADGNVLVTVASVLDGAARGYSTVELSQQGDIVREYPGVNADLFSWGGETFLELRKPGGSTLVNSTGDTLYQVSEAQTYGRVGRISLAGEPMFFDNQDSVVIIFALDGQTSGTYRAPSTERFFPNGGSGVRQFLRTDIFSDGIPDFNVEVREEGSSQSTSYLAIVDGNGEIVFDTVPPAESEQVFTLLQRGKLFEVRAAVAYDQPNAGEIIGTAVYDPRTLRRLPALVGGGPFTTLTYDGFGLLLYRREDSTIIYDPFNDQRLVSYPARLVVDGVPYRYSSFESVADTLAIYADALYVQESEATDGTIKHLAVARDLSPLYTLEGGADMRRYAYRGTDSEVYAQTQSARQNGMYTSFRVYRLSQLSNPSSVEATERHLERSPLVSPNPASDVVRLVAESFDGHAEVRVYTPTGAVAREYAAVAPGQSLSLGLPPGLYLVEATGATGERRTSPLVIR